MAEHSVQAGPTSVLEAAGRPVEASVAELLAMPRQAALESVSVCVEKELKAEGSSALGKMSPAHVAKHLWAMCSVIQKVNDMAGYQLRGKMLDLVHQKLEGLPDGFYKDHLKRLDHFCFNPKPGPISFYKPEKGTLFVDFFDENKLGGKDLLPMVQAGCKAPSIAVAAGKTVDDVERMLLRTPSISDEVTQGGDLQAIAEKHGFSPQGVEVMVNMATSGAHDNDRVPKSMYFSRVSEAYEDYRRDVKDEANDKDDLKDELDAKLESLKDAALVAGIPPDRVEKLLLDAVPPVPPTREQISAAWGGTYDNRVKNLQGH